MSRCSSSYITTTVLLIALIACSTIVRAAPVNLQTRRIVDSDSDSGSGSGSSGVAAAPPRLAGDQCEPLAEGACKQTEGCVWCRCAAVPSACYTSEQAKRLPPAVFQVRASVCAPRRGWMDAGAPCCAGHWRGRDGGCALRKSAEAECLPSH